MVDLFTAVVDTGYNVGIYRLQQWKIQVTVVIDVFRAVVDTGYRGGKYRLQWW